MIMCVYVYPCEETEKKTLYNHFAVVDYSQSQSYNYSYDEFRRIIQFLWIWPILECWIDHDQILVGSQTPISYEFLSFLSLTVLWVTVLSHIPTQFILIKFTFKEYFMILPFGTFSYLFKVKSFLERFRTISKLFAGCFSHL